MKERPTDRELMQQALDALEAASSIINSDAQRRQDNAITALRDRLARQDQEPTIRYDGLYEFAAKHRIDYNELCRTVREAIAKHGGNHA